MKFEARLGQASLYIHDDASTYTYVLGMLTANNLGEEYLAFWCEIRWQPLSPSLQRDSCYSERLVHAQICVRLKH